MLPAQARYSTPRRWDHLSNAELAALRPFFETRGPGRPIHDLRPRLDAIFWVICQDGPWRNLPRDMGPADTASRQFRRWAHAGIWTRLLKLLARPDCPAMLRRLEHWLCRAYRRALRILKLPGLDLAQRLGLLSALPGPWWMLPKPHLSETIQPLILKLVAKAQALVDQRRWREVAAPLKQAKLLHHFLGGTTRIPRALRPA